MELLIFLIVFLAVLFFRSPTTLNDIPNTDKKESKKRNNNCECQPFYQSLACRAGENCMWHPSKDPYNLKNKEWVEGKLVDKQNDQQ